MKRVALYARVSTDQQSGGLESQIRALKEHCERMKIDNFEIFIDENVSGAKVSRPSLDRMMAAVRKNELSTVIVYSFSRFARSTTHLLTALEEMKKHETEFISLTEKIETNSPMGRAFFTVIAAISQLERELIVERVKNGLRNARAKGKRIGRAKTRPSALIRALLKSGMTYRKAAAVARVSHGSIHAEKRAMLREEKEGQAVKDQESVRSHEDATSPETDTTSNWF
jgi:DNA invertase Pin-like site-specific DNA recombinase